MENLTKITLVHGENRAMIAQSPSGHSVVIDGSSTVGGKNLGARPMEMVLMGLGSCSLIDIQIILEKSKTTYDSIEIEISADRSTDIPQVFTRIQVHFIITGKNLAEEKIKKAIALSLEKYCSVAAMLDKTAQISHSYKLKYNM